MAVSPVSRFYFVSLTAISSVNPVGVQLLALLRQLRLAVLTQQLHRLAIPLLPMLLHLPLPLPNRSSLV